MASDDAAEPGDQRTTEEPEDKEDVEGHRRYVQGPDNGEAGDSEKGDSQGDPPESHF
jgi:hypothetical protein